MQLAICQNVNVTSTYPQISHQGLSAVTIFIQAHVHTTKKANTNVTSQLMQTAALVVMYAVTIGECYIGYTITYNTIYHFHILDQSNSPVCTSHNCK